MQVISVFNHAGGVAKTSTVRDLGYVLADLGFNVLLIDLDPQANLTRWLGVEGEITLAETVHPAIVAGDEEARVLPEPRRVHGFGLIPATLGLAVLEREIISIVMGIIRLREAVRKLEGYDFVLIDSPPSLGQLSALAVVAADSVVVPVPTNRKGLDGIPTVVRMVREYRSAAPDLKIALFVLTQHDRRTRHDRDSLDVIRSELPAVAPVSRPLNSRPAIYSDTQVRGVPVPVYAPGSASDIEIREVADELLAALGVDRP
ncbi:MAG TPA: ParA family protein [Deinococcales bacterium]|nr:ParA family protein [Deinococcales bacterium]